VIGQEFSVLVWMKWKVGVGEAKRFVGRRAAPVMAAVV
jgi:hypothetical protein